MGECVFGGRGDGGVWVWGVCVCATGIVWGVLHKLASRWWSIICVTTLSPGFNTRILKLYG